jgi:hypothetical protein
MSAKALATLQELWKNLTFATVTRSVARPEDIFMTAVMGVLETEDGPVQSYATQRYIKVGAVVTADERPRVKHSYHRFYGFAVRLAMLCGHDAAYRIVFPSSAQGGHDG